MPGWDDIEGIPEGFADGVDSDTTYEAGVGLTLDGTTIAVAFDGPGEATRPVGSPTT